MLLNLTRSMSCGLPRVHPHEVPREVYQLAGMAGIFELRESTMELVQKHTSVSYVTPDLRCLMTTLSVGTQCRSQHRPIGYCKTHSRAWARYSVCDVGEQCSVGYCQRWGWSGGGIIACLGCSLILVTCCEVRGTNTPVGHAVTDRHRRVVHAAHFSHTGFRLQ